MHSHACLHQQLSLQDRCRRGSSCRVRGICWNHSWSFGQCFTVLNVTDSEEIVVSSLKTQLYQGMVDCCKILPGLNTIRDFSCVCQQKIYLVTCSFQGIRTTCESKVSESAAGLVKSCRLWKAEYSFLGSSFMLLGIVLGVQRKQVSVQRKQVSVLTQVGKSIPLRELGKLFVGAGHFYAWFLRGSMEEA